MLVVFAPRKGAIFLGTGRRTIDFRRLASMLH